jgi:hypothetical protein
MDTANTTRKQREKRPGGITNRFELVREVPL